MRCMERPARVERLDLFQALYADAHANYSLDGSALGESML